MRSVSTDPRHPVPRTRRTLLAVGATALCLLGTVAPAGSASAAETAGEPAVDRCPAVVLLVGRGNDTTAEFTPRHYAGDQGFLSNGRESDRIGNYLELVEQRYRQTHDGASLFADVQVHGLPEQYYPADIPLPEEEKDGELGELLSSAGQLVPAAVAGVRRALAAGSEGPRRAIHAYEADTGCTPHYLLFGYSLGAAVLPQQEQWLAQRGQLAGAVYIGSPFLSDAHARVLGVPGHTRGVAHQLEPRGHTPNRIHYCLPDDLVCDPSTRAITRSLAEEEGGPHATYFRHPGDDHQLALADALGEWIDQVR